MKDVTIQVVKSGEGYHVIVNDDSVTPQNTEGWKSNDYVKDFADKNKLQEGVKSILNDLE